MSRLSGRRWAVVAAASGTVLIGGGAFWLSFVALADLAVRSGITSGQAWIWPLLVDGLIVVATIAVVALDGHKTAWYPWALLICGAGVSVTANAAHALVAADAAVPGLLAASVAAVPPLVLLASTHLTVVLTRSTKTPAPLTTTPKDEPAPALHEPDHEQPTSTPPVEVQEPPELGAGDAPQRPPALTAAGLVQRLDPEPVSKPEPAEPAPPAPTPERAGQGRRQRAEALREQGWSNKAIARELGVHASTIGRWFPRPNDPAPDARHETSADAEQKKDENKKE